MPRKKKKQQYDSYEDWEDAPSADDIPTGGDDAPKVKLEDFVIPEKVQAFVSAYEPCDELDPGAEPFDDGRLREVFKAYVCGLGDPLALYIHDLKMAGFHMAVSLATDEPCIFARRK